MVLASPNGCNDGSAACPNRVHLWFYTADCNRIGDVAVHPPLTENDVEAISFHNHPYNTLTVVGNVLVAGVAPSVFGWQTPLLASNSIAGWVLSVDVNRGISYVEDLARLGSGRSGGGWAPYKPAHALLYAPADDGKEAIVTLRARCPTGTVINAAGTVFGPRGTLGADMLDLATQALGDTPGDAHSAATSDANAATLCPECVTSGVFARRLAFIIFDTDEEFWETAENVPCQCLGMDVTRTGTAFAPEVRLRDLSGFAARNDTYWEVISQGVPPGDELFTIAVTIDMKVKGGSARFFTRLHNLYAVADLLWN
jgi:hypothetical protein